jgi:hypothetical protein
MRAFISPRDLTDFAIRKIQGFLAVIAFLGLMRYTRKLNTCLLEGLCGEFSSSPPFSFTWKVVDGKLICQWLVS